MPTVTIRINKDNLRCLTPYISRSFGVPVDVREDGNAFVIFTQSEDRKNRFFFDKRDFHSASDVIRALTSFVW